MLTAYPNPGYQFSAWGDDCSSQANPCTVTIDTTPLVAVSFSANQYSITVPTPPTNGYVTMTGALLYVMPGSIPL